MFKISEPIYSYSLHNVYTAEMYYLHGSFNYSAILDWWFNDAGSNPDEGNWSGLEERSSFT